MILLRLFLGLLASMFASLSLVSTQAMTGTESAASLLLAFGGSWSIAFGLAAAIPSLPSGWRSSGVTFMSYGLGGAIGGALIVMLFLTHRLGGSPMAVRFAFAIPFTVPWLIGAAIKWSLSAGHDEADHSR